MPPGGPVEMLRQFLIPYYPGGGFKFMDIEFDMGTTVKQKEYATKALHLAATIEQEYRNVLVVITDHTDQDSGDLFIGETRGKPIAGEVYEFMTCLLSPFERAIRGGTLVMLACGSIVRQTASFEALQDAVVRFGFSASIAFDAEHLQLAVTSSFLLNIIEATLIEGHDIRAAFPEALGYSYRLGMHSNVLLLTCDQDSPRIVTKDEDGQLAY
ncbi:hypothetical protein HYDPIDRAFT_27659 [Hydnomerulius pinastri MD-312]|nr:hypothetical protein HYDPIDRAFT_27659 [Hydnomerulius pinastri MD-312]